MTKCEDCGDETKRRTKCPKCGLMVCRWCYHHLHHPKLQEQAAKK